MALKTLWKVFIDLDMRKLSTLLCLSVMIRRFPYTVRHKYTYTCDVNFKLIVYIHIEQL